MNNEDVPALTRATGWTRSFNPGLTETKRMLVIIIIFQPARGASSRRMQDGVGADPERGNSLAVAANPRNPKLGLSTCAAEDDVPEDPAYEGSTCRV